ncbi:class I SAM-dependent methyltransferase [Candidatus Margulisiibacteriota bacterium]
MIRCPWCSNINNNIFFTDKFRSYYYCHRCQLIYIAPKDFISEAEEKARYDQHENSLEDSGYGKFLGRMFFPMMARIKPGDKGLDFGSGPGPLLSKLFLEAGFNIDIYDYFYAKNISIFENKYDFITATEVIEHLHKPKETLDKLWNMLKPGGALGLMTKLSTGMNDFPKWHYKNDDTHVCFFARKSFEWLAKEWNAGVEFIGKDVVVFQKT